MPPPPPIKMQNAKRKMQNYNLKLKNDLKTFGFWVVVLTFAFCLLNFIGCATIPTREILPTYNINGITYFPLISLCDSRDIDWEYDTFTKTVNLSRSVHKINLMVGDTLVLVDGKPQHLKYPVDIYQGTVVVPSRFKEQILDVLFKQLYPSVGATLVSSQIKRIVIDAGHGGTDPGAIGKAGLREKDVTLDIAKRLRSLLKANGFNVVMTRSADTFVPLSRRVDIADNSKAGLFISIHANANRVRSLSGFEVYYISPKVNDYRRALSSAENAALDLDSTCFAQPSLNLRTILWDMIYTNNRAESIKLASDICRIINRNLNARILGIKGANFYVLRDVRIPAVLIEIGFLSNYNEERMIKNNYYRQQIAQAITEGIQNYSQDYALMETYKQ